MKIYIAGKITRDPDYRAKFQRAEESIVNMRYWIEGHQRCIVLNPAILPEDLEEKDYMHITMAMLMAADLAVFLPDYEESLGAKIEWEMCEKIGIPRWTLRNFRYCKDGNRAV